MSRMARAVSSADAQATNSTRAGSRRWSSSSSRPSRQRSVYTPEGGGRSDEGGGASLTLGQSRVKQRAGQKPCGAQRRSARLK